MIRSFLVALVIGLTVAGDSLGVVDRPDKGRKKDPVKEVLKKIQGSWRLVKIIMGGKDNSPRGNGWIMTYTGNRMVYQIRGREVGTATVTFGQKGGIITMDEKYTPSGQQGFTYKCIVRTDGNTLTICSSYPNKKRPWTFSPPAAKADYFIYFLKRVK
jgi:uncharacterized protein (TIGR03067 family)